MIKRRVHSDRVGARFRKQFFSGVVLLMAIGSLGCAELLRPLASPSPDFVTATPTLVLAPETLTLPPLLPATTAPTSTADLPSDTGWLPIQPGLEQREIRLFDREGKLDERVFILRLEPTRFQFDVVYTPGKTQWMDQLQSETAALIVLNGGFYTEEFIATGRIVANGQGSGRSYGDFAGMFTVLGDQVEVRWLRDRPYAPSEPLDAGLQSFPMLVKPGGVLGFPADAETGRRARRTAIGQDVNGRILLMIAPRGRFTLHEFSQFLVSSDLNLDIALNLDGGPSSGLLLADPAVGYPALSPLPAIITVHSRE